MADGNKNLQPASRKSSTSMTKSDKGLSASLLAGSEEVSIASRKSSSGMAKSDKGLSASLLAGSEEVSIASRKSSSGMAKSDTGLSPSLLAGSEEVLIASRKSITSMKELSASLLAGSEEVFDFFCHPCSTENLHIEAAGFCTVCKEYLCDTCFRCHRKTTASKHHMLLGKEDMPRSTIVSKPPDKQQKVKAKFLGKVRVKTDDDTKDCHITDIAALPGGRMVVIDLNNLAIKLVDTRRNKVTCRLPLSSMPFGVVAMEPNKVAVSLRNEKKLETFTVTDTLSRNSTINVTGSMIFGKVCFDGDKFILVSTQRRVLMMVDMSGIVLSTVSLDTFTSPFNIAMGRDRSVLYISDDEAHTVTIMTLSGQIISVYKHDKLKCPNGVTVGLDDSVYVCSQDTHTVHQLTATGQLVRIILATGNPVLFMMFEKRGLAPFPRAITYDDEQDRLHISSGSSEPGLCDYVRSFKLQ